MKKMVRTEKLKKTCKPCRDEVFPTTDSIRIGITIFSKALRDKEPFTISCFTKKKKKIL